MAALRKVTRALRAILGLLRRRPRLIGAGVSAVAATATAVVARRHQGSGTAELPAPGPLAATTAESVHNAAKGAVISHIRQADHVDNTLVATMVRDALDDAAAAGVDLTAAAIGAVEGTIEVAHLIDGSRDAAAGIAARAVVDAADARGSAAGARVREVVAPYLDR